MNKLSKALIAITCSATLIVAGCSTSWISIALADLPVISQVAVDIAEIVAAAQGSGQVSPVVTNEVEAISAQVKNDLTLIQSLVKDYQAQPSATTVQKINAALADMQTNLNAILSAVHVNDAALQATIVAAVGVAVTTIASIESLLPTSGVRANNPVKPPSAKELKAEFNRIFAANGFPNIQIK